MNYSIEQIKNKVSFVAKNYGATSVHLFGSYAKGKPHKNSDIDLLVDKGKIKGLFELSGFLNELESTLGTQVDLVTTDIKDKNFLNNIKKEAVILYEFEQ